MGIVIVALVLASLVNVATASADKITERVVVRTYDAFGIPAAELRDARTTVFDILRNAQIDVVWRDCGGSVSPDDPGPSACGAGLGARELIVRIVAAGTRRVSKTLGYSFVDVQSGAGSLATIYGDRVEDLALIGDVDRGRLLGRAIAHEIGHLLLGTRDHAGLGLMRAEWMPRELARDFGPDWTFSRKESVEMRRQLISRERVVERPAAVVAHLGDEPVRCPPQASPGHACVIR